MNATDTRDRSYDVRVKRGDRVEFTEDTRVGILIGQETPGWEWEHRTVIAGTPATILSESNAGFRGIEASLMLDDGVRVNSVSTGVLRKA